MTACSVGCRVVGCLGDRRLGRANKDSPSIQVSYFLQSLLIPLRSCPTTTFSRADPLEIEVAPQ